MNKTTIITEQLEPIVNAISHILSREFKIPLVDVRYVIDLNVQNMILTTENKRLSEEVTTLHKENIRNLSAENNRLREELQVLRTSRRE
jgi:hypothetical protein